MAGDIFLLHAASVIGGRMNAIPICFTTLPDYENSKVKNGGRKTISRGGFNAPRLNHETAEHRHRTEFSRGSEVGCRVDVQADRPVLRALASYSRTSSLSPYFKASRRQSSQFNIMPSATTLRWNSASGIPPSRRRTGRLEPALERQSGVPRQKQLSVVQE